MGFSRNYSQVLVLLLRLRQICSHPSLIQESGSAFILPVDESDEGVSYEAREELERARLAGPSSEKSEERNVKELERLVEMLGKASDRKLADQTVLLAGGMQAQLEKTRQRNLLKV